MQKLREQEWVRTSWYMNPHRRRQHEMRCAHGTLRTQCFRRKPAPFGMRFHDKLSKIIVKQSIAQTANNHPGKDFEEQESAPMISKTRNWFCVVLWVFCGNIMCLKQLKSNICVILDCIYWCFADIEFHIVAASPVCVF